MAACPYCAVEISALVNDCPRCNVCLTCGVVPKDDGNCNCYNEPYEPDDLDGADLREALMDEEDGDA